MMYLYCEECAGPAGRTGSISDPPISAKVRGSSSKRSLASSPID